MSSSGDSVQIISIASTGKPGDYGIRALVLRPNTVSSAVCDAVYHGESDRVEVVAEWSGVQANPGRAESIRRQVQALVASGSEPRAFAFLKVDVCEHSRISSEHQQSETDETWDRFYQLVRKTVADHRGEIWGWQGDGGVCAFTGSAKEAAAMQCARSLLDQMDHFNGDQLTGNRIEGETIQLRAAVHTGLARERVERGLIHSRDLNFVAHLESQRTYPGTVSVSHEAYRELPGCLQRHFAQIPELFENHCIYTAACLDDFAEYISTRKAAAEELEREVIELRRELKRLRRQLDVRSDIPVLRRLLAEIGENIRICGDDRYTTTPPNVAAWDQCKGELGSFEAELRAEIEAVYVELQNLQHVSATYTAADNNSLRRALHENLQRGKKELQPTLVAISGKLGAALPCQSA